MHMVVPESAGQTRAEMMVAVEADLTTRGRVSTVIRDTVESHLADEHSDEPHQFITYEWSE